MRQESTTKRQLTDALFHAGHWMTIWNMTREALRYLNESLVLRRSLQRTSETAMADNKGTHVQDSMDSCDILLCMGDVSLASEEVSRQRNVEIFRNPNSTRYGCLHSLQIMHFSWLIRASLQQRIRHSEKQVIIAMSLKRQVSLWSKFILLQRRHSDAWLLLRRIGRQLYSVRTRDCFYLIGNLRKLQSLYKSMSPEMKRSVRQPFLENNLETLLDDLIQIGSEEMRQIVFDSLGESAFTREHSRQSAGEWQWIHSIRRGTKCPFTEVIPDKGNVTERLQLQNHRNVIININKIVRLRRKALRNIGMQQAVDDRVHQHWLQMKEKLYNSSFGTHVWALILLHPKIPSAMARKVLLSMSSSKNIAERRFIKHLLTVYSAENETTHDIKEILRAMNEAMHTMNESLWTSEKQPWQSHLPVVWMTWEVDLEDLETLYSLWIATQQFV